jgi:ribonuclease Y
MVDTSIAVVVAILAAGVGAAAGFVVRGMRASQRMKQAEQKAALIVEKAYSQQKDLILEAKDEKLRLQREAEDEARAKRTELATLERRLLQRDEQLDQRGDMLEQRDRKLIDREREIERAREELARAHQDQVVALERVSGLSADDAKAILLEAVREDAEHDAVRIARAIERQAREEAQEKARDVIVTAMQRIAADHTAEHTVSVIHLPSDEMKGRIIGREGRNIRALEQATGVDLIIDDTPETVVVSGFDPVRREVARLAITKLVSDGRIHPGRIEEVVNKARAEVDLVIRQAGETAAYETGVPGLPPEIVKLLGRLKYRTSYGQNVLNHSVETSRLAAIIAAEIGADVQIAKMGGLLHDIGKAVDHEVEGPHAAIGAQIAQRHNLPMRVINGIAAHHQEVEYACLEAPIVQVADAISASRPGARGESMDTYVKRLEDLQAIAESFTGVERSFAVQAGREVRILVRPEEIDDLASMRLARDIVRKIEETLTYPGQIKVTVIRETRSVEYAK